MTHPEIDTVDVACTLMAARFPQDGNVAPVYWDARDTLPKMQLLGIELVAFQAGQAYAYALLGIETD